MPRRRKRVDRQKLIVILVGLPARGKTFLCNKLMCYLNWCGQRALPGRAGQGQQRGHGLGRAGSCCRACISAVVPACRRAPAVAAFIRAYREPWCACACPGRRLGHPTKHFNVGNYRRRTKGDELQARAARLSC